MDHDGKIFVFLRSLHYKLNAFGCIRMFVNFSIQYSFFSKGDSEGSVIDSKWTAFKAWHLKQIKIVLIDGHF